MRVLHRGTVLAYARARMAAVLCLILLPLMAALGFMLGVVQGELSVSSVFGGLTFLLLGGGMFAGIFKMARGWEEEKPH